VSSDQLDLGAVAAAAGRRSGVWLAIIWNSTFREELRAR